MIEVLAPIVVFVVTGVGWVGWDVASRRAARRCRVIQALYGFIVSELDPDPHNIEAYLTDTELQREARRCVGPAGPDAWAFVMALHKEGQLSGAEESDDSPE